MNANERPHEVREFFVTRRLAKTESTFGERTAEFGRSHYFDYIEEKISDSET